MYTSTLAVVSGVTQQIKSVTLHPHIYSVKKYENTSDCVLHMNTCTTHHSIDLISMIVFKSDWTELVGMYVYVKYVNTNFS